MSQIQGLRKVVKNHLGLPWQTALSGPEKVLFGIYSPSGERELRLRLPEFQHDALELGFEWAECDLTEAFPTWMAANRYATSYYEDPESMNGALDGHNPVFLKYLIELVAPQLERQSARSVFCLHGLGGLFGWARASALIESIADSVQGRLLVFFPGTHMNNIYRLFDARDGWNYLAIPLESTSQDSP
jgi:hypothetical protein